MKTPDPSTLPAPIPRQDHGYAGDVAGALAYQWMVSGEAVMVDVRSDAERAWVGEVPGSVAAALRLWPGMVPNPHFDDALRHAVAPAGKVTFLCRSGVRSVAAAQRATDLGFEAYNILEGFEGDLNDDGHRGVTGGWRKAGLPWRQG